MTKDRLKEAADAMRAYARTLPPDSRDAKRIRGFVLRLEASKAVDAPKGRHHELTPLCQCPDEVLRIGRAFAATDTFRGAHFDTATLLCDTIEDLRGRIMKLHDAIWTDPNGNVNIDMGEDQIRKLLTGVFPDRRNDAHWGSVKYDTAVCSACGGTIFTDFETTREARERWHELYRFCPHCGAEMRKAEYNG